MGRDIEFGWEEREREFGGRYIDRIGGGEYIYIYIIGGDSIGVKSERENWEEERDR